MYEGFWGPPNNSFAAKYSDLCHISSLYQIYSTEHNVAYKHGCHFLQSKSPHNTVSVQSSHHTPLFCTHQPTHLHKLKRDNSCNSFWFLQQYSICSSSDPLPFSDPGFFILFCWFDKKLNRNAFASIFYMCVDMSNGNKQLKCLNIYFPVTSTMTCLKCVVKCVAFTVSNFQACP